MIESKSLVEIFQKPNVLNNIRNLAREDLFNAIITSNDNLVNHYDIDKNLLKNEDDIRQLVNNTEESLYSDYSDNGSDWSNLTNDDICYFETLLTFILFLTDPQLSNDAILFRLLINVEMDNLYTEPDCEELLFSDLIYSTGNVIDKNKILETIVNQISAKLHDFIACFKNNTIYEIKYSLSYTISRTLLSKIKDYRLNQMDNIIEYLQKNMYHGYVLEDHSISNYSDDDDDNSCSTFTTDESNSSFSLLSSKKSSPTSPMLNHFSRKTSPSSLSKYSPRSNSKLSPTISITSNKSNKSSKSNKSNKSNKSSKSNKSNKSSKSNKSTTSNKSSKSTTSNKSNNNIINNEYENENFTDDNSSISTISDDKFLENNEITPLTENDTIDVSKRSKGGKIINFDENELLSNNNTLNENPIISDNENISDNKNISDDNINNDQDDISESNYEEENLAQDIDENDHVQDIDENDHVQDIDENDHVQDIDENDHVQDIDEDDANMSEDDANMSEDDANMSEDDANMSEDDANINNVNENSDSDSENDNNLDTSENNHVKDIVDILSDNDSNDDTQSDNTFVNIFQKIATPTNVEKICEHCQTNKFVHSYKTPLIVDDVVKIVYFCSNECMEDWNDYSSVKKNKK
jgi:hypothetical protein